MEARLPAGIQANHDGNNNQYGLMVAAGNGLAGIKRCDDETIG